MTQRFLSLALASTLIFSAPLAAQTVGTPPPAPPAAEPAAPTPAAALPRVALITSMGTIVIEVENVRAPLTAANFLRYVDQRKLDGTTFYRAMDLGRGYGLVQMGTRNNPQRTLRPIAHEPTSRTGLSHLDGTISLARLAPGTGSGDFFITVGDLVSLDAQPAGNGGDPDGFAAFGRVVEGMDVVRSIMAAPTDPNLGEGVMRGQMIAAPVRITTARRVVAPVAQPAPSAPPSTAPVVQPAQ
jgi:peptidyl-prolyl cis-trans isomerase A (cyclophilin A)